MNFYQKLNGKTNMFHKSAYLCLLPIYLGDYNWNSGDTIEKVFKLVDTRIRQDILFKSIVDKKIAGNIVYIDRLDDFDIPCEYIEYTYKDVDEYKSKVNISDLVSYVYKDINNKDLIPDKLFMAAGLPEHAASNMADKNISGFSADCINVEPPIFKGLAIESLTKEKFEELKKSYGMLIVERDKLKKAIPIAVQVGLLFYSHGLKKPATAKDFIKEYNKQFDGIPQILAKLIYDGLPDEYKSLANNAAKNDDIVDDETIDDIISASIATGLICSKKVMANSKQLEEELSRCEFETPPQKYLNAITAASKKVVKKYKDVIA